MSPKPGASAVAAAILLGWLTGDSADAQQWIRHWGGGPTAADFCGGSGARLQPGELLAVNGNGDILLLGGTGGPNGQRRGWGSNAYGVYAWPPTSASVEQCVDFPHGDGPPYRHYHTQVAFGPAHAAAIATGIFNGYFIGASVVCWGNNSHGQCNVPLESFGTALVQIEEVACGSHHTLARNSSGQVRGWGGNQYGQSQVPAHLGQGQPGVFQIAAGAFHSMARTSDGALVCWGAGSAGDVVDSAYRCGQADPPVGLGPIIARAAGGLHSVGLRMDGTVACWGAGTTVQTWNFNVRQSLVPADLGPCTKIAAGAYTTAALTASGSVRVWGYTGDSGYCAGQCDLAPPQGSLSGFWPGYMGTTFLSNQQRPPCPADLAPSCNVDGADLGILLASWGPQPPGAAADLDMDGAVDGVDLGLLLAAWGPCPD